MDDHDDDELFREILTDDGRLPPARPKFELKNVSHTHDAIMNFMLSFPEKPLRDVAAAFGVTQSWLSVLIHSNCFQARLKEKQDYILSATVVGIKEKMEAVADIGLEKIAAELETSQDKRFILESTKMALANLGFGAKPGGQTSNVNAQNVNQVFVASPADLEAARKMMSGGSGSSPSSSSPADATPNSLPAPAQD